MLRFTVLLFALLVATGAPPTAAQIIVSESAGTGERILMSETMRRAEHKIMIRAIGRVGDEQTDWALTFQSTDARSDVRLTADGEAIEPLRITTDEEAPGGLTTLFFSGEDFFEMAYAARVEVTVGERTLTLPDQIREDMQDILNRSES